MLSDTSIRKAIESGEIVISPFQEDRLQPASYDLSLGEDILLPSSTQIMDLRVCEPKDYMRSTSMPVEGYTLQPGFGLLGSTEELIGCPSHLAARVEGRSSLGRIFLAVHITAGFIDSGFEGRITLEIVNLGRWPIKLWPGMPIAQIGFFELDQPCARSYGSLGLGSHYQGQTKVTPASGRRNGNSS